MSNLANIFIQTVFLFQVIIFAMNKWCAICCEGQFLTKSAEEKVTLERMKQEREGFFLSGFKNHDNETDEEASRTTQV